MLIQIADKNLKKGSGPLSIFLEASNSSGLSDSKLGWRVAARLAMLLPIVFGLSVFAGCAMLPPERGSSQSATQPQSSGIEQARSVSMSDQSSASQPIPIVKHARPTSSIQKRADANGVSNSNAMTLDRSDRAVSQVGYQTPTQPQYEEITLDAPPADEQTLSSPKTNSAGGNGPPIPSKYAPMGTDQPFANRQMNRQNGGATQGFFRNAPNTQGQILAVPQVTASERATALLEENNQLRLEIDQAKRLAEAYHQRLQQQDRLWESAKLEFVDVRNMLNQVNGENVLLKQQNEQLIREKDELTVQFQTLVQSVEQTLDEMLMKSFTEPPKQENVPVVKEIPH